MTRRRRHAPPVPAGPLASWTIQRATVTGLLFGIAALLLAGAPWNWPIWPYAAALGLTLLCGLSTLWITYYDIRTRGRGGRMRPIRAFDVAAGALLTLPALYGLWLIRSDLGLG